MFLVDTSVWISYLRDIHNEPVSKFEAADSEVSFARLEKYLKTQRFYHPLDPLESYTEAARIYSRCPAGRHYDS